ncbi:hypothetical protein DPMN_009018 [Dreissena polymorpha]|uniref:Uncharacterized protein n=1 Tax=Dreissena polymorpha TaxID=45954 RepID=A0A9D4RXL0_DREPO|nr:hypothetical protein DPMN_009018 [Dreissena polymorpha]
MEVEANPQRTDTNPNSVEHCLYQGKATAKIYHPSNASLINLHQNDIRNTAPTSSRTSLRLTTFNVQNVKSNLVVFRIS